MEETSISTGRPFVCDDCPRAFGMRKHLRRHQLTHLTAKPFQCLRCSKRFVRKDGLQRHEVTHDGAQSLLRSGSRACGNCAAAKARCSGEPARCARCLNRNLNCTYPGNGPLESLRTQSAEQHQVSSQPEDGGSLAAWDLDLNVTNNWLNALSDDCFNLDFATQTNTTAEWPSWSTLLPVEQAHINLEASQPEASLPVCGDESSPSTSTASLPGKYYVDGQSSRLPHTKRRRTMFLGASQSIGLSSLPLQSRNHQRNHQEASERIQVPDIHFRELLGLFQGMSAFPEANSQFYMSTLPSKKQVEAMLGCYWAHLDPILPFVHSSKKHSFCNVYLTMAMSTAGAHYTSNSAQYASSMNELLGKALSRATGSETESIEFWQGEFLHCLSTMYQVGKTVSVQNPPPCWALKNLYAKAAERYWFSERADIPSCEKYMRWILQEQVVRLAYAIWTTDAIYAAQYQSTSLFTLHDARLPLPANDDLWNACTHHDWAKATDSGHTSPSLQEALQDLYISKNHPRDRCEFARIITLYGIHHRMREVSSYFSDPLSFWNPATCSSIEPGSRLKEPIWLPSVPVFAAWQNTTCDALDVLHWQANATIGYANGFEHPTVFHLHFSRVVLLAPCSNLVGLARHIIDKGSQESTSTSPDAQLTRRWAIQHQFKARLAAIHAGVLLWHVRRYSTDAFYEAPAVGLATLLLWAFGTYALGCGEEISTRTYSPSTQARLSAHTSDVEEDVEGDDSSHTPRIILLDRPTDDELVQRFIRRGHEMEARISGIGSLCAPNAPKRLLRQSCKLVSELGCWKVNLPWLELLQDLEKKIVD